MLIAYSYEYNIKTVHLILAPYLISTDLHERPWAKARAAASAPLRSSLLDRERHDAEIPPVWGQTVLAEFQAAQEAELHGARSRGRREPVVGLEAPDPSAEEAVDVIGAFQAWAVEEAQRVQASALPALVSLVEAWARGRGLDAGLERGLMARGEAGRGDADARRAGGARVRSQPHMTCTRTRSSPLAARDEPRACMYSPQDPPRVIQLYLFSRGAGVCCARWPCPRTAN